MTLLNWTANFGGTVLLSTHVYTCLLRRKDNFFSAADTEPFLLAPGKCLERRRAMRDGCSVQYVASFSWLLPRCCSLDLAPNDCFVYTLISKNNRVQSPALLPAICGCKSVRRKAFLTWKVKKQSWKIKITDLLIWLALEALLNFGKCSNNFVD